MRSFVPLVLTVVLLGSSAQAQTAPTKLKTQKEKASYTIGLQIGGGLKGQRFEFDPNALAQGLLDGLSGAKPAISAEEQKKVMAQAEKEVQASLAKEGKEREAENKKFLAENGKKAGVETTKSGLQYLVLKEGTGDSPKATDTVVAHYEGKLLDGTVFDSSYERKEPARFSLEYVIPGWTEGLQLMKVGGKTRLFIPAKLGYDLQPPPGSSIPANAVLIFEVELVEIPKAGASAEELPSDE